MIVSVHQPQYIPWLGFFDKVARSDKFVFLDNVQYKEREFQNRNRIRTSRGSLWLTVPVISGGRGRQVIKDVRIDNSVDWGKEHMLSLKASYGRAPYFKEYFPFFEALYSKRWDSLAELNVDILSYIFKELNITTPVMLESGMGVKSRKTERIIDICRLLKADEYLSGAGGKDYLDEDRFADAGIRLVYQRYEHPVYRQQFMRSGDDFIPYMSVLDLLFNEGPKSKEVLSI